MPQIQQQPYGVKISLTGFLLQENLNRWLLTFENELEKLDESVGVFIDARDLKPIPEESREILARGKKLLQKKKIFRCVLVYNSDSAYLQMKAICNDTDSEVSDLYIDSRENPNWEKKGHLWLVTHCEHIIRSA